MNQTAFQHPLTKIVISTWLFLWVLAIPLVHVHPETDHQHGERDHVHGGMFHSVFSQDLECEYSGNAHYKTGHSKILFTVLQGDGHGNHLFNHLEIGWVFASSSSKDFKGPILSTPTALLNNEYDVFLSNPYRSVQDDVFLTTLNHRSTSLTPRAPPIQLT